MLNGQPLRAKGYNVLPVSPKNKHCRIPGWNWIDDWEGQAAGLGLNLVGLAMIDIDLDFEDLGAGNAFVDEIIELFPKEKRSTGDEVFDAPWRLRSNSTRRAILFRCEDVEHLRFTTSKWAEGKVEFKIGRGEFMFGWGKHPSGAQLAWTWEDDMPPVADPSRFPAKRDLPHVSLPRLRDWCSSIEDFLVRKLGERVSEPREFKSFTRIEDMQWDMAFRMPNGRLKTLEQIYQGPNTSEIVNLTPWRPDSDSEGGHVTHSHQFNGPCCVDFVTGEIHTLENPFGDFEHDIELPEGFEPEPLPEQQEALDNLGEVAKLYRRYVFYRDTGRIGLIDDPTGLTMSPTGAFVELGPKDRAQQLRDTPHVATAVWDPTLAPSAVFRHPRMGVDVHNTFCLPRHEAEGGSIDGFLTFMKRFLPDQEERETVIQWLAAKVQRPADRGFAVVFVGPQGSGKGTVWQIIADLWGYYAVSNVSSIKPIYDGTYQDILYRKMYVLIDEVSSEDIGYRGKKLAAERLKGFIEPHSSTKTLNIKGQSMVQATVCATVGIATNNLDALPLGREDRRYYVARTGDTLPPYEVHRIQDWRTEANFAALWRYLSSVNLEGFNFMKAPHSETREFMALAGMTDVDHAVAEFLNRVKQTGGYYSPTHIREAQNRLVCGSDELRAFKRALTGGYARKVFRIHGKAQNVYVTHYSLLDAPGHAVSTCLDKLDAIFKSDIVGNTEG